MTEGESPSERRSNRTTFSASRASAFARVRRSVGSGGALRDLLDTTLKGAAAALDAALRTCTAPRALARLVKEFLLS